MRALQKPPEPAPAGLAGLSADDLGGWLRAAGLGEHARRFAESAIAGAVLAALPAAELRRNIRLGGQTLRNHRDWRWLKQPAPAAP